MRSSVRLLLGALATAATAVVATAARAQVPTTPPPTQPPAAPKPAAPNDSARRAGASPAVPGVPARADTTGRRRTGGDSVPLPPPSSAPRPAPVVQPPPATAVQPRDTTARSAPTPADTVSVRRDTTANPFAGLDVSFTGRLETRAEQLRNERCAAVGTFTLASSCRAAWVPDFDFQYALKTKGAIEDRFHIDVDYDAQREFQGSNILSMYYEAKRPDARIGRFEVGNVSFAPPASRFVTAGIPSNNLGAQVIGRLGNMRWRTIAAFQQGNVQRDRVFTVGERASQTVERTVNDYEIEPRRFFWTIDPRRLPGYPDVDVLDRARMALLARSLPDTLRPARVVLYRQLIGAAYQNPRGPRLRVRGGARPDAPAQTYEVLREGVDYYVDPSLLWVALVRPLVLNGERLAVAYEVDIAGHRTRWVSTGGTPDVERTSGDQVANLIWEPELAPTDSAFVRELRNVYRVGGEDLRRETMAVRVVAGIGDQEKPQDPSFGSTYLQLFGLAERTSPTAFDVENRVWPRPQDPNVGIGGGTLGGKLLRDYFVIFPSLQPFARDGGVRRTANPSNDTLYTFPSEFLNSAQRPQSTYRLRLRYESEGGLGPATIALGSLQIRPGSERLTALGRALVRDVDYTIDYELGTVTFLDPHGLFPAPTNVTAKFEENPTFAGVAQPTRVFGAAAEYPTHAGSVYVTAVHQSQRSLFNRAPLGFEAAGSTVAGVGADLSWDAPLLARFAARITHRARLAGDTTAMPSARISFRGELAMSKPTAGANQKAYLETFEGQGGFPLATSDAAWYYGSRPPSGGVLPRLLGVPLTLDRAATMAWQSSIAPLDSAGQFAYRLTDVDPAVKLSQGSGLAPTQTALWLTLFPLRVGGLPSSAAAVAQGAPRFRWKVDTRGAPTGRRWRSIRTVLNPAGADLSRVEDLEFYALVNDPRGNDARRNPVLVFDFGEISENSVAFAPETLTVQRRGASATAVDSLYGGRRLAGYDTLDTERDSLSRVFNATINDIGLPGDRATSMVVRDLVNGGAVQRRDSVPVCRAAFGGIRALGDPTTDCTAGNARLDEEDIDQDGELNFKDAQIDRERIRRFVIDLGDLKSITRITNCNVPVPRGLGDSTAGQRRCWVQVRVPFRAPTDSLGTFNARRVRAARLTVITGRDEPDTAATTLAVAAVRLTGAPWLRRTDRVATGVAGDSTGTASSFVLAGTIGTQDSSTTTPYEPPPGTVETTDQLTSSTAATKVQVNERSLRVQAGVPGGELAKYERAEAYLRFPEGTKNLMTYRQLRVWARGNGRGWGPNGDMQFFIKIGRDENNFYLYRTPVNAGAGAESWLPEVVVNFDTFHRLRAALQETLIPGRMNVPSRYPCTGVDAELVQRSGLPRGVPVNRAAACLDGYMVYTVDGNVTPPNLAAVQELAVGMIRVDDAHRGADAMVPGDTLDLWVDDVRLTDAEASPGMAGEIGVGVHVGDLADVRVNFTRRDPNFRQLGEAPTFVTAGVTEIGATVRLDRLLPNGLGLALPLTVTHTSVAASPTFIPNTDLRGEDLAGLRTPHEATTSWALTVRRATPLGGALGALIDPLSLTSTYVNGDTRSSYQDAVRHAFSLRADYDLAPGSRVTLGGLRWTPTTFRLTSHLARTGDRQLAYLTPVSSALDTARLVRGLDHVWQHGATIELRPVGSLTASLNASTLRDLRPSPTAGSGAADSALDAAFRADRARLAGIDMGFERERQMTGEVRWEQPVTTWLKPRATATTNYTMLRDPNAPLLGTQFGETVTLGAGGRALVDTTNGVLPRRILATQQLEAGAQLDLAHALFGNRVGADSATRARAPLLARILRQPIQLGASRTLSSTFDGTTANPGVGAQLGFGGVGGVRAIDGTNATLAGVVDRLTVTQVLSLPFGLTLTNRAEGGPTRSWWRRASTGSLAEGRGTLRTVPDLSLRWAWRPASAATLGAIVSNVGATAGVRRQWQTALAPADSSSPADERAALIQSWPLNGTVTWSALGGLTTSGGYTIGRRTDDVPGTRTASTQRDGNAEVTRGFKPPASWGLKTDIQTRVGWQESRTRILVNGRDPLPGDALPTALFDPFFRTVQSDLGRRSWSFGASSGVAENMTLNLTGTRVRRFNTTFGSADVQSVVSAVLQINYFAGSFR